MNADKPDYPNIYADLDSFPSVNDTQRCQRDFECPPSPGAVAKSLGPSSSFAASCISSGLRGSVSFLKLRMTAQRAAVGHIRRHRTTRVLAAVDIVYTRDYY